MQLTCRSCGKPIPPEDINLDTVLAKCRFCHAVFDFSDQIMPTKVSEAPLKRDRGEIPLPKQFSVEEGSGRLLIIYNWARDYQTIILLMFVSIFPYTLLGMMLRPSVWSSRKLEEEPLPVWAMMAILLPILVSGIGTAWGILALSLNKTKIQVEGGRLRIFLRPIPWPGNHDLDSASFDQLYCEKYLIHFLNGGVGHRGLPIYRYALNALCKDGTKVKLVRGLVEVEQVFYLEQLLEKHLRITDRPIRGEIQDDSTRRL